MVECGLAMAKTGVRFSLSALCVVMSLFRQKVLYIVSHIPKGRVMSYKEVAIRAGSPRAYRAVGTIMMKNADLSVPCHRVIKSDGSLGAYNRGGFQRKKELLQREGVVMSNDYVKCFT